VDRQCGYGPPYHTNGPVWSYMDAIFHCDRWWIGALCVLLVDKTNINTKTFGCKQAALSGSLKAVSVGFSNIHSRFGWSKRKLCVCMNWEKNMVDWAKRMHSCGVNSVFQNLQCHRVIKTTNLVTISQMRDPVSPIYFLIDFDEELLGALVKQPKM
jgi:hypothetical protein